MILVYQIYLLFLMDLSFIDSLVHFSISPINIYVNVSCTFLSKNLWCCDCIFRQIVLLFFTWISTKNDDVQNIKTIANSIIMLNFAVSTTCRPHSWNTDELKKWRHKLIVWGKKVSSNKILFRFILKSLTCRIFHFSVVASLVVTPSIHMQIVPHCIIGRK